MWLRFSPPPPAGESSSQKGVMLTPTLSPPKAQHRLCKLSSHAPLSSERHIFGMKEILYLFFVALVRKQRCFVCLFVCGLRSEAIHVTGAAVQTFLQEVNAILWPLPCSMLQTQQPQPESVFKQWNETLTMQRGLFIPPRCRQSSVLPVHLFGLFVACHRIFQHFRHIREQKTKS